LAYYVRRAPFLPAIAFGLTSCAIVDQYSSHAVAYNIEAEQAQEQQLVLNIVRASLRRPMQFTSVTTITGSQTVSATAGLTAPFGPHSTSNTGTFGASASGGPIFTVPVLDTQDFYRGMLQGIPPQLIDLLLHAGYSPELIFNLLIEKIEMTRVVEKGDKECPRNAHWTECEFYVANDPSSDTQIELFHALIRYLVVLGMTTQPRDDPSKPPPQGAAPKSDTAKSDSSSSSSSTKDKNSGSSNPLPVPYVFCFAPKERDLIGLLDDKFFCGNYKPANSKQSQVSKGGKANADTNAEIKRTAELTLKLSPKIADDLLCIMGSYDQGGYGETAKKFKDHFKNEDGTPVKIQLKFFMRSTMGLLNFLGHIVARDLNPELFRPEYSDNPRRIWIGDTLTYRNTSVANDPRKAGTDDRYPATLAEALLPKEGPCRLYFDWTYYVRIHHYRSHLLYDNLFVLDQGAPRPEGSYLSVDYFGRRYFIPNDPQVAGWTTQVLDITKQLIAVNTSASQLPQTSVISVISP
jgi:hypothetical protein